MSSVGLSIKYLDSTTCCRGYLRVDVLNRREGMPLIEVVFDDRRYFPHVLEFSLAKLIVSLVIDKDKVPFFKGVWVDMDVIMGFRPMLGVFDRLECDVMILIFFFKSYQSLLQSGGLL